MLILDIGRREMGKTTLAAFLIRKIPAQVIFDPRGLFPCSLARVTNVSTQLDDAMDALHVKGVGQVIVTPERGVQHAFERVSAEVKAWLKERSDPIAFLLDEARMVDTSIDDFDWMLRCATRASALIVMTAHRPTDIPVDVRAIADLWCIFQTTQSHDLQSIAARCHDDVARIVEKLSAREFVAWDDAKGLMTVHRDPKAWYMRLTVTEPVARPDVLADAKGEARLTKLSGLF